MPYLPGPSSAPLADSELPPPIYNLEPLDASDVESALDRLHFDNGNESEANAEYTDIPASADGATSGSESNDITKSARALVYHPAKWQWATLTRNRRVTAPDWWQDVREVELDLGPGV